MLRTLALAALPALLLGPILANVAVAQVTSCEWYARTALDQQRRNIDRACGFTGQSWSSDRDRHLTWCKQSSPDEWKREAQQREQMLAKCAGR